MTHTAHDAFISYSRRDGIDYAERLDAELFTQGIISWRDVRDIDPSQDFTAELERAIEASSVVIVCVTPDARRPDSFVRREIAYAQVCGKPIAVARFAEISPPISVVTNTFFDFCANWSVAFEGLSAFCRSRPPRADGHAQSSRSTYLGALYSDVVEFFERAIMLPAPTGGTGFLPLSGTLSVPDSRRGNGPLSDRFFNNPPRPMSVANVVEAFDRARGPLAIVGNGGTGKTVCLMGLARDLAAAALIDPAAPLPLVMSAATWLNGSAERISAIPAWIASETRLATGYVHELLGSGRVILLIDGLDELPAVEQRKDSDLRTFPRETLIRDIPMKCRLVVTIRSDEYTESAKALGMHSTFRVDPLRDDQLGDLASRYPHVAAAFEAEADIREAARNPLILGLLYLVTSRSGLSGGVVPKGAVRDLIFADYLEYIYSRESIRRGGEAPVTLECLSEGLGELAMMDAGGGGNRNLFEEQEVRLLLGESKTVTFAVDMGILVAGGRKRLRFFHVLLRDYFAYSHAVKAMSDPDSEVRDRAAWALWQIPDKRVVPLLMRALTDPYKYARGSAAGALGRIGDPQALPALEALTADCTPVSSIYGSSISEVARWAIDAIRSRGTYQADEWS